MEYCMEIRRQRLIHCQDVSADPPHVQPPRESGGGQMASEATENGVGGSVWRSVINLRLSLPEGAHSPAMRQKEVQFG